MVKAPMEPAEQEFSLVAAIQAAADLVVQQDRAVQAEHTVAVELVIVMDGAGLQVVSEQSA